MILCCGLLCSRHWYMYRMLLYLTTTTMVTTAATARIVGGCCRHASEHVEYAYVVLSVALKFAYAGPYACCTACDRTVMQ